MGDLAKLDKYVRGEYYIALPKPTSRNPNPKHEVIRYSGIYFHRAGNTRPYAEMDFQFISTRSVLSLIGRLLRENADLSSRIEDDLTTFGDKNDR